MNRWAAMLVLCAIIFPAMVPADIYRCVSEDGVLSFSDQPCGENAEIVTREISIDQMIALSRPYRQPHHDPNRISKDLRSHSKMICDRIVSGGHYKSRKVSVSSVSDEHREIWVTSVYETEDFHPWRIEMIYTKQSEGRGNLFWLTSISIFKWWKPFTPPVMQHITQLHQTGPGVWSAPGS